MTQPAPATWPTQSSFVVGATASPSGLAVSVAASPNSLCSNSGNTVTTGKKTGTCTVTFNQAGNANYAAAVQVVETTNVQ